jgi:hypothetical protein
MKKKAPARATCATTAGYIYQAWPKGKLIPKSRTGAKRKTGTRKPATKR